MTSSIFDLLSEEEKKQKKAENLELQKEAVKEKNEGQLEFMTMAEQAAPQQKEDLGRIQSFLNTLGRGAIKGVVGLGRIMGPLPPKNLEEQRQIEEFPQRVEELLPRGKQEGIQGFIEKGLERGLETAPTALAVPGGGTVSTLVRSGASGFAGQAVEELGGGEVAQTVAEIAAFAAPSPRAVIKPKKGQEKLVKFAEKFNLTPQELAPALNTENIATKTLAKAATKEGRAQEALSKTKKALGGIFDSLKNSPEAKAKLSQVDKGTLFSEMRKLMEDIPSKQRQEIIKEFNKLSQGELTAQRLMRFWNNELNPAIAKGNAQLGRLKDPLTVGLVKASPTLAEDFKLANQLYGQFAEINYRLKPGKFDKLFSGLRGLRVAGGFVLGNFPIMAEAVTEVAAKRLAREMIINPRFQNLSGKFVQAVNANKLPLAKKVYKEYVELINEFDPKAAQQLEAVDIEELFD